MTSRPPAPFVRAPGEPLIGLREVVKHYRTGAGDFVALDGVDLSFHEGEFVSIVGRSGSGKSTLLNMITGVDRPTSGTVRIAGVDIHHLREGDLARWRGRSLGIVFQFYQLLPTLSLLENTMLPMDLCDLYAPEDREPRALDLLDLVGLREVVHKMPGAVSGGQQQSAALARALANDPPIIVADEPTGNLDSRAADVVFHLFETLAEQGKTVVMVTHDPRLARRASRTVLLADGQVVAPAVAEGLPFLSHRQMLQVTRALRPLVFARFGERIRFADPERGLGLVLSGEACLEPHGQDAAGRSLGPGGVFGLPGASAAPVELLAPGDIEFALVPLELLARLQEENPELGPHLAQMLAPRVRPENAAASQLRLSPHAPADPLAGGARGA